MERERGRPGGRAGDGALSESLFVVAGDRLWQADAQNLHRPADDQGWRHAARRGQPHRLDLARRRAARPVLREVFDAEVGPTRPHGQDPGETMTVIRIGPHTELNIVTIEGNTEPDRQTPMWGAAASTTSACTPPARGVRHDPGAVVAAGASDGTVNDFGSVHSMFFRDPDGLEGEVLLTK